MEKVDFSLDDTDGVPLGFATLSAKQFEELTVIADRVFANGFE